MLDTTLLPCTCTKGWRGCDEDRYEDGDEEDVDEIMMMIMRMRMA